MPLFRNMRSNWLAVSGSLLMGFACFPLHAVAVEVPKPKSKPVSLQAKTSAKVTAEKSSIEEGSVAVAQRSTPSAKPVYDDGSTMPTASPSWTPPTPKQKPEPGVDLSAHIPWVMPSRSYTATAKKVGRPGSMLCNLTFDDGPHKIYDPIILDELKKYNAKATFYLVGRNVKRYPDIVRRMKAEGHEIANHSWKHDNLRKLSASAVSKDLSRTNNAIEEAIGNKPTMFRPPYGSHNPGVIREAKKQGMETLLWTVDSLDWKKISPNTVRNRVVGRSGPGAVILLHSIQKRTALAMPAIMKGLHEKGCIFVTSEQWLEAVSDK